MHMSRAGVVETIHRTFACCHIQLASEGSKRANLACDK